MAAQTLPHQQLGIRRAGDISRQSMNQSTSMSSAHKSPARTANSSGKTSFSFGQISQRPMHPKYTDLAARLQSFQGQWPTDKTQKPQEMSEAGFFYAGEFGIFVGEILCVLIYW
jgi:hypothetical protein